MSIAQYLLFGYTFGKRTLFENVFRLPPASLIKIDLNNSKIEKMTLHDFNFENKNNKGKSVKENVDNLVKLFCEACKNRNNGHDKNIVSLSGGLDSRAVAAGLIKSHVKFHSVTYSDYYKIGESDGVIAKELAKVLNIDWKIFYLDPPKGKDLFELLDIKNGLNFLGMSYILPFYEKVLKTYGSNIVNFSGDGGDKIIPDIRPSHHLRNLDELADYIIANHYVFPIDKVAQLTKIDKKEIISELKAHLNNYPEKDYNQKYVHFIIFERGFKWLFEGEDRNRFYFWTLTPFYSIKFFNYVMNCPDNLKIRYNLYRQFLKKLSPRASAIDYNNWKMPIASNKSKLYLFTRDIYFKLPPRFTKPFRKRYKKALNLSKDDLKSIKCFLEVIRNCKSMSKYISTENVKNLSGVTTKEFYNMLTLISTMEKLEGRKCTIEKYCESDFP
jgi:asparagine synthase (glutamine-hydrolysing)